MGRVMRKTKQSIVVVILSFLAGCRSEDSVVDAHIDGIKIIGGGYVVYRIFRLLPSVVFPPSLIPNLIIP